jgi:hypothetical protein
VLRGILLIILTGLRSDDAKARILNTEVDLHLLQMVKERIFDGTTDREGIDILTEIFNNGLAILYFRALSGSDELHRTLAIHYVKAK